MSERKQIIPQYGPFAGMRVIDSGSLIAMPYAATLLADFGAEVIHIERPGVGDTLRVLAPLQRGRQDRQHLLGAGRPQQALAFP